MSDIGAELADICEAAAAIILPLWRSGLAVSHKADESPVTEADRAGEALILKALAERFPDIPVISEEDASEFGTPDAIGPRFFLVDPLDGTKAFVRGDPHFTVNIGLVEDGRPVAGAVAAPPSGEVWWTAGGVAMKRLPGVDAHPVRVRPWPADAAIAQSLDGVAQAPPFVATGFPIPLRANDALSAGAHEIAIGSERLRFTAVNPSGSMRTSAVPPSIVPETLRSASTWNATFNG